MSAITSSVFSFSHKMFAQIPYRVTIKALSQLTRLTRRILRVGPQLAECGGTFLTETAYIHDEVVGANDLYIGKCSCKGPPRSQLG